MNLYSIVYMMRDCVDYVDMWYVINFIFVLFN